MTIGQVASERRSQDSTVRMPLGRRSGKELFSGQDKEVVEPCLGMVSIGQFRAALGQLLG
jgi:hypothetical protein